MNLLQCAYFFYLYVKIRCLEGLAYLTNRIRYGSPISYQPNLGRYIIPYQMDDGQLYLHVSSKKTDWRAHHTCLPFSLVVMNDVFDVTETFRQLLGPDRNPYNIPDDFTVADIIDLTTEMTEEEKETCRAQTKSLVFYMDDGEEINFTFDVFDEVLDLTSLIDIHT